MFTAHENFARDPSHQNVCAGTVSNCKRKRKKESMRPMENVLLQVLAEESAPRKNWAWSAVKMCWSNNIVRHALRQPGGEAMWSYEDFAYEFCGHGIVSYTKVKAQFYTSKVVSVKPGKRVVNSKTSKSYR